MPGLIRRLANPGARAMTPSPPDLKALFLEALERPEGPVRAAFLAVACRGDPALRAGIEALLEAHERAGGFLGSAAEAAATAAGGDSSLGGEGDASPPGPPSIAAAPDDATEAFALHPGPNGSPAPRP